MWCQLVRVSDGVAAARAGTGGESCAVDAVELSRGAGARAPSQRNIMSPWLAEKDSLRPGGMGILKWPKHGPPENRNRQGFLAIPLADSKLLSGRASTARA